LDSKLNRSPLSEHRIQAAADRSFLMAVHAWYLLAILVQAPADAQLVTPGPNLVVEGIPPIPTALAEVIDRYTEFRPASFTSWHPSRREMLITTRFGDTTQVHRVQFPGAARTQLTFFRDNVFTASYQPTTGDYFVFAKDRGGDEMYQTYRYDPASGAVTLLSDGKSRNTGLVWSHAGDRFAYGSTRRTGKDVDLYVVAPTDPKSDHLVAQFTGGGWSALAWSPDDRILLMHETISINESYLWLCDVDTGKTTPLTPRDGQDKVAYHLGKFSKDGKGVYVTTDNGSEFQRLAYLDLATRAHTFLTEHIPWDVSEFALAPDGARIAFVANEAGKGVLHMLDVKTGKELPVPPLPVGEVSGLRWHKNGADVGFNLQTVRAPSDAYSLNVATANVERWTFGETGGIPTTRYADPELVRWKSFDGREITGFLYSPPSHYTGKRPVIIDIHGGPESQFRPRFLGRSNYYVQELGVALLYPNIRGSSGYGKTFLQLDNGFRREDAYKDIGALLDWIKTRPDLDADRIMVTGGSYGGHMTLAVATFYSDRIRCAVDVVGISNLVTFLEHTSGYRRDLRRVEYGDERDPQMRAFLNRVAPLNNIDKIQKPLFIVQGQNDPRVPQSEAEQMVAALRKSGTPVWYLLARDEGHGFRKKKNADFQFYATVRFMQQFLLN
jgi:dipeptidyl aminopeptidase/acylaminoacyl peptidase